MGTSQVGSSASWGLAAWTRPVLPWVILGAKREQSSGPPQTIHRLRPLLALGASFSRDLVSHPFTLRILSA